MDVVKVKDIAVSSIYSGHIKRTIKINMWLTRRVNYSR